MRLKGYVRSAWVERALRPANGKDTPMNRDDNADHMPGEVVRWADRAQYHSTVMPDANRAPGGGARPTVKLLNATPDPLGSLAALCGIYEGRVIRSLRDVTDDERRAAWKAMQETVLNGPLEAIQFHFLVEGVTRAFTHQAVRNRFSFFAQESLRFAVVDDEPWIERQAYPPSLAQRADPTDEVLMGHRDFTPEEADHDRKRVAWNRAIVTAEQSYKDLVAVGIPAEEARGLMPHSMTTRYHWVVNIRALLAEAGKRLCTQAQFEWRVVMAEIVKALRERATHENAMTGKGTYLTRRFDGQMGPHFDGWQFELMASSLQPVCYQEGHCGFMAKFDRGCTIRERVNRFAANDIPSSHWQLNGQWDVNAGTDPHWTPGQPLYPALIPIHPKEWLANPAAARVSPGAEG